MIALQRQFTRICLIRWSVTAASIIGLFVILHLCTGGVVLDQVTLFSSLTFPSQIIFNGYLQYPFYSAKMQLENIQKIEGSMLQRKDFSQSEACVISFYAQVPVEPDGTPYYFHFTSISKDDSERQTRKVLLDVTKNAIQPVGKSDTAVFFINPEKVPKGIEYDDVRKWLKCSYQGPNGLVPVLGKYFYYKNYEDYGGDSLSRFVSYIANCHDCASKVCGPIQSLDPLQCFMLEKESYPPIEIDHYDEMLPKETVMVPFSKSDLCSLPQEIVDVIRHRAYTSSLLDPVSIELTSILQEVTTSTLSKENRSGIFTEIDARVMNILAEYHYHCTNMDDNEKILSDIHMMYRTEPFVDLNIIREGLYIEAFFKDGIRALLKFLTQSIDFIHPFRQGVSEISAHYADMLLGFYMTPTNVYRRVFISQECDPNCDTWMRNENTKIDGIVPYNESLKRNYHLFDQTVKDPETGIFYINVDVVGWVKHVQERDEMKVFKPLDDDRFIITEFFVHNISSFQGFLDVSFGTTKQNLKDISDLVLFDFIVYNYDRGHTNNWVMKAGRYLFFDNGGAFDAKIGHEKLCSRILHCPRFFCRGVGGKINCTDAPYDSHMCRFNKHAVVKLKRVGPGLPYIERLGPRFWKLTKSQSWYHPGLRPSYGPQDVAEGLDERVAYSLGYISDCVKVHGKEVFF